MGVVDISVEGRRQLERASRLLDAAPQGKKTPVRKSLEQLFGESRGRAQSWAFGVAGAGTGVLGGGAGLLGASPVPAGASRLLQGPQADRLSREVENFSVGTSGGAATSSTAVAGGADGARSEDDPSLGVREFFALRHERVVLGAVEEAQRDCMRSLERHSFKRIQADWDEAKAQIMSAMKPHRLGAAAGAASAPRGMAKGDADATTVAIAAPPQDAVIIDALLRESFTPSLVQRIGSLSCESCPPYSSELRECWGIVSRQLDPTPRAVARGSLAYLQDRFASELRAAVHGSSDAKLGGVPDDWAHVSALGRIKFNVGTFPSSQMHVWYAAYIAARAGFTELLGDLPRVAAPYADRCPMLRTVCTLMARRLQAVADPKQRQNFTPASGADAADLVRADLAEEGNGFHDVLVALLLQRSFAFARLPEGTVEDWLWFRLHAAQMIGGSSNDQAPDFVNQLEALRQHALAVPFSHYDAGAAGAGNTAGSAGGGNGRDVLMGAIAGGVGAGGVVQTLNFVKVLLLTAQFGRAVQQLRTQDRLLRGPALHIALVLHKAGTLEALAPPEPPPSLSWLICEYASHFGCNDQLPYFRVLDLPERREALQRLLLRGGAGTSNELLGYIDQNGQHRPGFLERTLNQDGTGDHSEFVDLCARAGRAACEHGQYREALRLLHLGGCHTEVLQVICRCLRLPIWRECAAPAAAEEAGLLGQDLQRFLGIYERNLDRYAVSSQAWAVTRKLYAARTFHALCDGGHPEAALELFDREQLLPLSAENQGFSGADAVAEVLAEQPRIVADYVRILRHAATQGVVVVAALRSRVRQLQVFLASRSNQFALDQDTVEALATLALC
eukprot:TRINITY_DN38409_c0_g2_i1.p1 TRINITY_DN38409_c0_g2~~TRINITY_DN38409_c0_g2_i1.p1  ORF type:complete len:874 (+),score=178.54 TRINITY_DN38409_c0_g2_i1:85-2622(+)